MERNQVAVEKDNALTRVLREVAEANAQAGKPAGRSAAMGPDPGPRVRSQAMTVAPLSAEEKAERDRKAKELGIMPKDELDELQDDEPEGGPMPAPAPASSFVPKPGFSKNRPTQAAIGALAAVRTGGGMLDPDRMTAREFLASKPQLPDFKKVQQFDLTTNTIYVDGMAFPIPQEDVLAMKSYAVQIVLDHVVFQLAQALIEFGVPKAAAMAAADRLRETINDGKEGVSSVQGGAGPDGLQAQSNPKEGLGVPVVPQAGDEELRQDGEGPSPPTA